MPASIGADRGCKTLIKNHVVITTLLRMICVLFAP